MVPAFQLNGTLSEEQKSFFNENGFILLSADLSVSFAERAI